MGLSVPPDPLIAFVLQQAGLDPAAYRAKAMDRRLSACLRALRVTSSEAAISLLTNRPALTPLALDTLLIGVSEFFRDRAVFDFLRTRGLPELMHGRERLRVLSAGCSDGQELYSVAVLLAEMDCLGRCELVGVDCRPAAVAAARAGRFSGAALAGLDPAILSRYFHREGIGWRVSGELRRKTDWRVENLLSTAESQAWDMILFRNVAIYLDLRKAEGLWARLVAQLTAGGLLVTGRAERPPGRLTLARLAPCLYRKPQGG